MIQNEAFFKLSYGLFVLAAREGEKENGCIINTGIQLTDEPKQIAIAVNKGNYTHDMIARTGAFTLSVLAEDATFPLIQRFGFQSGRDADKFAGFSALGHTESGLPYITEGTNAYFAAKVVQQVDCGSHTPFIAAVEEGQVLRELASLTYADYFAKVKPQAKAVRGYECQICGYVYEGAELPEDFVCPLCNHGAQYFEPVK